jgi:hypothetical protein
LLVGRQLVKEQKKADQARQRTGRNGVQVDHAPPGTSDSRFKGGEYVDYEEVKD